MGPNAPSPPIAATQAFDCSTDELWALVSAPGNLNDAHPFCETNEALVWDGETHRDRLVYLNGRTYVRVFQTWNPGKGYTLLIGEENGLQSYVVWTIQATETGSSLTITVHPYLLWPTGPNFSPSCLKGYGLPPKCGATFAASPQGLPMSPRPVSRCRATISAGILGFLDSQ